MDKGTLYTLALSMLGDRNYVPGTPEAEACDTQAQHVIGLALEYARWGFATVEREVELDEGGGFRLPDDCQRLQDVGLERWRLKGRRVVAEEGFWSGEAGEKVKLSYTSNVLAQSVCLPDYEPQFCEACVSLLAARLAPRLTGNFQLAERLEQRGMEALYRAKLKDAQERDSNDQKMMSAEELMYGRVS